GPADLMNAIALNSSIFNGARIVGPAVAGVLVGAIGEGWCFFANGASFIAVIAGLLAMRLPAYQPRTHQGSAFAHMMEGLQFALRTAPIRTLLLVAGLMACWERRSPCSCPSLPTVSCTPVPRGWAF